MEQSIDELAALRPSYRRKKRILDLVIAIPVTILLAPLALVVATIIKLRDGGPALFRAKRVGAGGSEFTMYKFRTMVLNADKLGGASTSARDPRITPIGHWIRRWKLDEIPQLYNVIRGDMSLVGPRPTLDWDVARYTPEERRLLAIKPGITDWASIRFRDEGEILKDELDPDEAYDRLIRPEKIRLGLRYVETASIRQDVSILVATGRVVAGWSAREHERRTVERALPAFHRITEDWSTPADQQQWQLASQRYSLAAEFGREKVLLEVGSGTAYGLSRVAEFTRQAVGLEIDERNLAIARARAPQCQFVRGDAESLPFGDHQFDCVVALEMFYYLSDQSAFVMEARRILRSEGTLLITMPNSMRPAFQPSPFSTSYPSSADLRRLLEAAGFQVELYGSLPVGSTNERRELLRRGLVRLHLVPSTIEGRARLKGLLFRNMRRLDTVRADPASAFTDLTPLGSDDGSGFAVIVAVARLGRTDC